ncbi:hypothetical protein [Robbsia andropogonis]|uniref:hypothetical protein n=2 Tax=Robbsia andropogonis TaxID=28092 RepID=UPI0012F7E6F1|nr:hypothetical protein [Robbsia andropogonis]
MSHTVRRPRLNEDRPFREHGKERKAQRQQNAKRMRVRERMSMQEDRMPDARWC